MKILRQGMAFTFFVCFSLIFMVSCARTQKIEFIDEVCIIPFKGYHYKTCHELGVVINDTVHVVPKGFETDLASIPRVLWPIVAPQYTGFVAPAIVHDYLYRCNDHIDRKFADEVLYSALMAEGVSKFTASKFYLAVRLFGASHYEHGQCNDA